MQRTLSALPNDVMSKIQCGELHSELFGRRHSSLQSHGLFALIISSHLRTLDEIKTELETKCIATKATQNRQEVVVVISCPRLGERA